MANDEAFQQGSFTLNQPNKKTKPIYLKPSLKVYHYKYDYH